VAETGNNSSTIPLDDPRWIEMSVVYQRRTQQIGHFTLAAADLMPLIEDGSIGSKLEALDHSSKPPTRIRRLLTPEDFRRDFQIGYGTSLTRLALRARSDGPRLSPCVAYLWEPDIKKFWPDRIASDTLTEPAAASAPAPEAVTVAEPATEPTIAPLADTLKSKSRSLSPGRRRAKAILQHLYSERIPSEDEATKADLVHAIERNWNSDQVPNLVPSTDTLGRAVDDFRQAS
jgi:hypothetical protein